MNEIVRLLILTLAATVSGCVSTQVAADNSTAADTVYFVATQSHGNFTITCRPRTEEIGRTSTWVDTCNEMGRDAVTQAVNEGLIAPINGPAFGMSSEFMRSMPVDASVSSKAMSRDIPLIGSAL